MNNVLVLGGLDDTHQVNDFFTNYVYDLKIISINKMEEMYVCNARSAMMTGRGCFGVCSMDNFIYVFGGVTGKNFDSLIANATGHGLLNLEDSTTEPDEITEGLSDLCEKYDFQDDQWYQIAPIPYPMRNPGCCALTSDSVYLFGGKTAGEG